MLDWLKNINREYPGFWKQYLQKFEHRSKRFVIISLENSGQNPDKDVIFSIGAIAVTENSVSIGDEFEVIIPQYKYLHDNDISNEFIIESKLEKQSEPEAIEAFIDYIGNAVLVGHRIHFDIDLINMALSKLQCGRLKNEALDIEIMHRKLNDLPEKPFPLDELLRHYKVPGTARISAADDAYSNALLFLKLKSKLGIN
ncbi:3'-5' exonuclease [Flavobacterium silvaticum]|uniref:3'-5' exonuclease n=1 Tax=Flavobacterium silvaticum TaxID=1852020 RepID=A0A972FPF3_9FLAO|nr:3'-5' exonuclease [Flavobacterium silvaticum]NMH28975.1 3'-5' exonuclease [Flavobacterium silvaticum]